MNVKLWGAYFVSFGSEVVGFWVLIAVGEQELSQLEVLSFNFGTLEGAEL